MGRRPPTFEFFGGSHQLSFSVANVDDKTIYDLCDDCDIDFCHKYLFAEYVIEAAKRWYCENRLSATLRELYVVFEVYYNRRLDIYSHELGKPIKSSTCKETPRCMCDGSLKHVLTWAKYHMERNEYYCNLHGVTLITKGEVDKVVHKDYGMI